MRKLYATLLTLLLFVSTAFARDVTVQKFTPQGEVNTNRPQITVLFNGSVVSAKDLNKPLTGTKSPLRFRPALAGTAKWVATNKLIFTPSANLQAATRYDADFGPGGLKTVSGSLVAGPQSFTFHRPALSFDRVTMLRFDRLRQARLRLDFSTEVVPARLRGFLTVFNDAGNSVGYDIEGTAPTKEVIIRTNSIYGKTVKVVVSAGILPDKGDLPQASGLEATLNLTSTTTVTNSNASMSETGRGSINIELNNNSIDLAKAKGFIEIDPAVPFTLSSYYNGFRIEGDFAPRSRVKLTIRKGLTAHDAEPMSEDFVKSFIFPDMDSSVRFPAAGMFLTPADSPRIALETVNIETLEVSAWRLYNNNVSVSALALDNWRDDVKQWSKPLGSRKYRVGGMVNEITRRALDLSALGCEGEGVYLVEAKNADGWESARMLLTITDTALSARVYKRGLQVWAASISEASPRDAAEVKVYSSSNQLLLTGSTDANGLLTFDLPDGWQDDLRPSIITAEKDGVMTFVKLGVNQLTGRDVDVSGAPWNDNYEGLWIMPRALWQPGEMFEAEAIVRSTALELPGQFPLVWSLTGRGIELASGTITLDENSIGKISTPIPATVDSGSYSLRLTVPGTKTVVAERSVQIEEFRPPQVEAKFADLPKSLTPGQETQIKFNARYLFGGSGAGLKYELDYNTVPEVYTSKRYPGYVFGSEMAKDAGRSSGRIDESELDDNGEAIVSWTPDEDLKAPSIIRAHLRLNVMEANGRWTGATASFPIYPTRALIGVMKPTAEIRPNSPAEIGLVAVDSDDNPLNLSTVVVEISRVTERYVMVSDDNGNRMTWQEEISEPIKASATISNGRGTFTWTPRDEGVFRITFSHKDGRASMRVSVWQNWTGSVTTGATMPDRVEMHPDKAAYAAGETARIAIKSPFGGRATLTVGSDKPLFATSFQLTGTDSVVEVPMSAEMLPNGWAAIQVVRAEGADTKPPYRALGAVSLKLDLSERKLNVTIEVPEKAEPGLLPAKITVTNADGSPANGTVALSLVDRGILLLSGNDNADPFTWFTRRRGLDGRLCDIYDSLLPIEARGTALLHPAGGDDAAMGRMKLMANADMMSPVRASDYKPLSIWLPTIEVKDGTAVTTVSVPEFAGALRVEAIAVDGRSMGRVEAETKISRPVVIDLTLPRFASPEDRFNAALNITAEQAGSAAVSITPAEGLEMSGTTSSSVNLASGVRLDMTDSFSDIYVAPAAHGTLTAAVELNGKEYSVESGLAIRPGWPLISLVGGSSVYEGDNAIEIPDTWFPGTGKISLSISGAPIADAVALLDTLNTWGCGLDRLVGRGWVALSLPGLLAEEDKDHANPLENRIALNTVVAGLSSYQLYDGSWSSWRGSGTDPWGSVAALHLLTAIKQSGTIDPNGLSAGYQWLRRYMAEPLPEQGISDALNARAYGAYVLAADGDAPLGWMNWLEERAGDLSGSGRALLAAAYGLAGEREKASSLAGTESNSANAAISLPEAAFRMLALDAIEPGGADSRDLAARISAALAKGQGRRNARNAGSILMALGVFNQHVVPGPVTAKLFDADGNQVAVYDGKPVVWQSDRGGKLNLVVNGGGSLWYSWTASGVPTAEPKPYSRALRVERSFIDAKSKKAIDLDDVEFGQEVIMRIKVTPTARAASLRLSALLPAGLEATSAGEMTSSDGLSVRSDLRFDRLLLLISGNGKSFEWQLPCRAVYRGTFGVPPISVEALGNSGIGYLGSPSQMTVH